MDLATSLLLETNLQIRAIGENKRSASSISAFWCTTEKMDRPLSFANQITPNTHVKWTAVVQIIERRNARRNDAGTLFRSYMVTDTTGTKVPIVLFGSSIAFFPNSLQPFKRYYISNATVTVTNPLYRVVEYEYTWSLRQRNLVEPYDESVPSPLPCTFVFDRFSELYRFADQTRSVCIKALVIHALPAHDIDESGTVRDFVVMDHEKIPMLLRVWDDLPIETDVNVHARYKVPALIVAYGLKVTTHHGLSLGTKSNAYILHNPPLNEERPLKEWYAANSSAVTALLQARAYRDTTILFHPPNADEIVSLTDAIASIGNVKTVWTKGKMTYLPGQEKLWFEACEKCFRPVDADVDWNIWCSDCQERTKVVVRGRVTILLSHGGTIVETTIKSPDSEKLIPYTANELKIAANKNKSLTSKVEAALEKKEIVCFMKFYDRPSRGSFICRYPLLKVYTELEVQEYHERQENAAPPPPLDQGVVLTIPTPTSAEHIGSSSTAPVAITDTAFFTPSTKKVLEDTLNTNSGESVHADQSPGSKRMLSFEDIAGVSEASLPASKSGGPTNNPPQKSVDTPVLPPDASHTTPSKKLKGKDNAA